MLDKKLALKGLKRAERFVREQQDAGVDVRWEGWDMVFFRESPAGRKSPEGAYRVPRGGTEKVWGFDNRVVVDAEGVWKVDYRNVKRIKRTRR